MSSVGSDPARPIATVLAGCATATVAVGADVVASGHPMHTVGLGIVVAAVTLLRLTPVVLPGVLFATLRGAIVAQPVLHAAMKVLPAAADRAPGATHGAAEVSITVLHVLVTAAVVVAVAGAERLLLLAGLLQPFAAWLRLPGFPTVRPRRSAPPVLPQGAPAPRWSRVENLPRRGPPATPVSVAR